MIKPPIACAKILTAMSSISKKAIEKCYLGYRRIETLTRDFNYTSRDPRIVSKGTTTLYR